MERGEGFMKGRITVWLSVICFAMFVGCSTTPPKQVAYIKPDPNGSTQEKIQYHRNEIRKYRAAVEREEEYARRSLSQHRMSDVRQSNNRKEQYLRKIEKNQKAIEELQGKESE